MTRDNDDRMRLFMGGVNVKRLALNMDQVDEYNPPPNPAKITDSRAGSYMSKFGDESWELDALEPSVITKMIEDAVKDHRDDDLWKKMVRKEEAHKADLQCVADNWDDVAEYARDLEDRS